MAAQEFALPVPRFRPLRLLRLSLTGVIGLGFGLVVGAAIVAIIATRFFGYSVLRVDSNSMAPKFQAGDVVVIKPVAMTDVKRGDVVYFANGPQGIPTVHRVIGINELVTNLLDSQTKAITSSSTEFRLMTKGDANAERDAGEVTGDRLHGAVWFSIPFMGGTSDLPLRTFMLVLTGILLFAWLSWELYSRFGARSGTEAT